MKTVVKDPKVRLSARKALEHKWIQGTARGKNMDMAHANLKEYQARRKMRVRLLYCKMKCIRLR